MEQTARRAGAYHATNRTLWGLARSPELGMAKEGLYGLISRETGKEHMHELTQAELDRVAGVLMGMKDGVKRSLRNKRTDEGGNTGTTAQRRKIYMLTGELGWNDDNGRITGFAKHMFGVERLEWLTKYQCGKLIEALKDMLARGYGKEGAHGQSEAKAAHPAGKG